MRSWRRSIAALMMMVVLGAIAFASLSNPTKIWLGLLMYLKTGLLLYAAFRARYGRGPSADWWFGFAVFGWGYLSLDVAWRSLWFRRFKR